MMEAFPYSEEMYELNITGKQLKHMISFFCREEIWEGDVHEYYQLSKDWDIIYDRKTQKIVQMKFKDKDVEDDQLIRLGLRGYDFGNLKTFFDISPEETLPNGGYKVIATSSKELLYEFLENSDEIPEYPFEGRLVVTK